MVPVIAFGFTEMLLGAWIGHSVDDKEDITGEFPEIFTKSTVIGAVTGFITGAKIGYFLGKDR